MAYSNYPLNPRFVPHSIRGFSNKTIRDYCRNAVYQLIWTDDASCSLVGGVVKRITIKDYTGANFLSKSSWINICASLDYKNFPDVILLDLNGNVRIAEYADIGFWGIVRNLIESATRTAQVLGSIAVVFDLRPVLEKFSKLGKLKNVLPEKVAEWLSNTVEYWQRGNAWLDKKLHIGLIAKLNLIGRSLVPEYAGYWRAQENMLAYYSNKIFGNTTTLQSYIHLAEVTYRILIQNTDVNEEEKRYQTLKHGAELTHRIMRRLNKYERSPSTVWSDIMFYTYGEGNKYLDEHRIKIGEDLISALNELGKTVKNINSKLNDLQLFNVALDKTNLITLDEGINAITTLFNETYNNNLKPTFKLVEKVYTTQQRAIAELERREQAEAEAKQRALLLSADPDTLTDEEKTIQSNQFIKILNNAIGGVDSRFEFKTVNIEEL